MEETPVAQLKINVELDRETAIVMLTANLVWYVEKTIVLVVVLMLRMIVACLQVSKRAN